eukprot:COSAG06_NODE_14385_length_1161_cov_1.212806_2_plen_215_part_00
MYRLCNAAARAQYSPAGSPGHLTSLPATDQSASDLAPLLQYVSPPRTGADSVHSRSIASMSYASRYHHRGSQAGRGWSRFTPRGALRSRRGAGQSGRRSRLGRLCASGGWVAPTGGRRTCTRGPRGRRGAASRDGFSRGQNGSIAALQRVQVDAQWVSARDGRAVRSTTTHASAPVAPRSRGVARARAAWTDAAMGAAAPASQWLVGGRWASWR